MDIQAYFSRIGLADAEVSHTYEFLKKLQYQQVLHIPYENLDLVNGKLLSYTEEALFDKMVTRHRGGYCFELNGLLSLVLKELGFAVTDYLGRFLKGMTGPLHRRHRISVVCCEGQRYLLDAGMGQAAPRYPLLLEEGLVQEQFGETYKLEKDPVLGWVLYEQAGGQWRQFYAFTEEPQMDFDFIQPSFYFERHPDSTFNKFPIVAIKTPAGRKTINDREYKVFEGTELTHIEQSITDERLTDLLSTEFGICV